MFLKRSVGSLCVCQPLITCLSLPPLRTNAANRRGRYLQIVARCLSVTVFISEVSSVSLFTGCRVCTHYWSLTCCFEWLSVRFIQNKVSAEIAFLNRHWQELTLTPCCPWKAPVLWVYVVTVVHACCCDRDFFVCFLPCCVDSDSVDSSPPPEGHSDWVCAVSLSAVSPEPWMAHCKGNASPAAAEIEMFSSSKLTFPSTELLFIFFPSFLLANVWKYLFHAHTLSVTEQNGHFMFYSEPSTNGSF